MSFVNQYSFVYILLYNYIYFIIKKLYILRCNCAFMYILAVVPVHQFRYLINLGPSHYLSVAGYIDRVKTSCKG